MNVSSARALSTLALAVAACISIPASAGDSSDCPQKQMTMRDVEGSGHLTAASHEAGAAKRFEMMDVNKDGKVTAAEIGGSRGAEAIAWANEELSAAEKIKKLDGNRDGALSAKEYAEGSQAMFDKLDADGDGVLSQAEMPMPRVSAR